MSVLETHVLWLDDQADVKITGTTQITSASTLLRISCDRTEWRLYLDESQLHMLRRVIGQCIVEAESKKLAHRDVPLEVVE